MALVPAICTQCGAKLEVDNEKEAAICPYCGAAFIVEKAINNYTTNVVNNNDFSGANVTVNTGLNIDNLLDNANDYLEIGNKKKAIELTEKVLQLDSKNARAWEIQGRSEGIFNWRAAKCITKAIEYADEEYKKELEKHYYYLWATAWDWSLKYSGHDFYTVGSCCMDIRRYADCRDAIPNEYIAGDPQLQEIIINHVNSNYKRLAKQWENEINKHARGSNTLTEISREVEYANGWIECWRQKMPCDKKNVFVSKFSIEKYKGGCYIATCVYGSYNCPEVWTLRRFRDFTLDETWYGRLFIKCYYAISPAIVKKFGETKWFRTFWKTTLDKMVHRLNKKGVENTKYSDKY